ncbi:unnamed protein product [Thelazia callipaeda]|uniref:UPF0160 protein MYG1, mitochondrial n=1 Tax=Thelazia callipaeda TaxID=103827 RepID=A0A0N5DBK1_THECL|nr:unnamed protein product [Thelazia callipaeda]
MPKIGTHNGTFHCDEVKILSLFYLPRKRIDRTRDEKILNDCDILVDVGGKYDHATRRYDHHQRDFVHTMSSLKVLHYNTKLSSAGLIYAHFGKRVINELLKISPSDPVVDILYRKMYEIFVESVDAIDNGISQYDGEPRYYLGGTLSSRVSILNPAWNEDKGIENERFMAALKLVGVEFTERVEYLAKSWLPARDFVVNAINSRFDVDKSGQIIYLKNGNVPWKSHFFSIEKELKLGDRGITYVIFADSCSSTNFKVQAIPVSKIPYSRVPLPDEWLGLRDVLLSEKAKIPNCIFVHSTGFIGGNTTFEGAVQMAKKSLSLAGKYRA